MTNLLFVTDDVGLDLLFRHAVLPCSSHQKRELVIKKVSCKGIYLFLADLDRDGLQ